MPTGAFNICCPRDYVSRLNGGISGAPLKLLRVDSALRALSSRTAVSRTANVERTGRHKWVKMELSCLGQKWSLSKLKYEDLCGSSSINLPVYKSAFYTQDNFDNILNTNLLF